MTVYLWTVGEAYNYIIPETITLPADGEGED